MSNQPMLGLRRYRVALVILVITCCAARAYPRSRSTTGAFVNASTDAPLSTPADLRAILEEAIPLGEVTRDVQRDKDDLITGRIAPLVVVISSRPDALIEDDWPRSETTTVLITAVFNIDATLDSRPSGPPGASSWRSFLVSMATLDTFARNLQRDPTECLGVFVFGTNGDLAWYAPGEPTSRAILDAGLISETFAEAVKPTPRRRPVKTPPEDPPPPPPPPQQQPPRVPAAAANDEEQPAEDEDPPPPEKPNVPPAKPRTAPKPQATKPPQPQPQPLPPPPPAKLAQSPMPAVMPRQKPTPKPPPAPTVATLKGLVAQCESTSITRGKTKLSAVAKPGAHKAVLLSFWATWCTPCVAELPDLAAIARRYADDLTYVGILTDSCGERERLTRMVPQELRGSQYEILDEAPAKQFFPGKTLRHRGDIPVPFFALFDETGRLLMTFEGSIMVAPNQQRFRIELNRLSQVRR